MFSLTRLAGRNTAVPVRAYYTVTIQWCPYWICTQTGISSESEGSILLHDSGKKFIAVWQNCRGPTDADFRAIAHVVRDTMDRFLS